MTALILFAVALFAGVVAVTLLFRTMGKSLRACE